MKPAGRREHGGGLDAAIRRFGGRREDWLDLSTGINPAPYPLPDLPPSAWHGLPDTDAGEALEAAARDFWNVPAGAAVLAAPGASALIADIPRLAPPGRVELAARSYNEHEAAFRACGWEVGAGARAARVVVHPDNPTGMLWSGGTDAPGQRPLLVIDESFCDVAPGDSHVPDLAGRPGVVILKSLGKFWGLAGLRLGFAIGDPTLIVRLGEMLGPWPVSGPALHVGRLALGDRAWARATRARLHGDAARLDALLRARGARPVGGCMLFRLYEVDNALKWQKILARDRIWSRIFSHTPGWLRLGLPPAAGWARLERALGAAP